jgi:hypothetical protein
MADGSACCDRNRLILEVSQSLQGGSSEPVTGERSFAPMIGLSETTIRESASHAEALSRNSVSPVLPDKFWHMLLIVWVLSAVYVAVNLKHGWIPHDDGAFAQSAERVLNGELPHRDFDEIYTGGLAFANALAFRVLGVNLASLRIVLFAFFVAWVPAVFYIASRFAGAYVSAGLTLVAVAWSVPNYSAAVPSWYNLFFAIFGTAALLRYIDTRNRRWLFVAGVCGGFSIVVKIIGLYFVAAAILFFVFYEQSPVPSQNNASRTRDRFYPPAILTGLVVMAFLLARMILRGPASNGLIYFLLPPCALMIVLASREFGTVPMRVGHRFTAFFKMFLPFAAGTVIPVLIFLIPYLRSGTVPALVHGVFVLPTKRFDAAAMAPPALDRMRALVPIALLLSLAYCCGKKVRVLCGVVLGLYLGFILQFSASNLTAYGVGWHSIARAIPLVTVVAAVYLGVPRLSCRLDSTRQERLMLLFSMLAMTSLVQFPFSAPIYFCYVAPVLVLAASALFAFIPRPPHLALGVLMVFCLLFAVWRATPAFVSHMGHTPAPPHFQMETLNLPRGGNLRIDSIQADVYEELIPFIQAHASGGFTYAGPDCAEIYFLTGLKNPTRTLFDSFDEPEGRTERILRAIDAHHITTLTFNDQPGFAGKINQELEQAVQTSFPHSKQVGHFQVRWRE